MLAVIDLTRRQTARVLEQAVRCRARFDIEPRSREGLISGTLAGRRDDLFCVDLHDLGRDWCLAGLIGAFCDVTATVAGELYLFSTCVVDAEDSAVPQRLLLAPPETVQLINRRKFDRLVPTEPVTVELWPADGGEPISGTLNDISFTGLDCCMPRKELDDRLLIDDQVRVRFPLPRSPEVYELTATVCVKTPTGKGADLHVGLEFTGSQAGDAAHALERLRAALLREYAGSAPSGGDA